MNIKSLRIFVNVIEDGTLAMASARMNISQSAASRLIQILEDEFQVQLFYRDKKRLVPTEEGESFYPEALRILSSIAEIPTLFKQIKATNIRPLRIICHPRIVSGLVVPAMIQVAKLDPDIHMKLEVHPRRHLGRRILHDYYDVGISALPLPAEVVTPFHLAELEICVALPKGHALSSRAVLTTEDLIHEDYIALDDATLLRSVVDQELARTGKKFHLRHEVSSTAAALRLVGAGLGFTLTDKIGLDPVVADHLAIIPWSAQRKEKLGYFVSDNGAAHPARSLFIDSLQKVCAAL